jgi:hypothetical protein
MQDAFFFVLTRSNRKQVERERAIEFSFYLKETWKMSEELLIRVLSSRKEQALVE